MRIPDFVLTSKERTLTQHFVAIDRFHGGAAANRKFQALALDRPVFEGTVQVDVRQLEASGASEWGYLLLLFLLRDLREGDVRFGANGSKGYGEARAMVKVTGAEPAALLHGVVNREAAHLASPVLDGWEEKWLALGLANPVNAANPVEGQRESA